MLVDLYLHEMPLKLPKLSDHPSLFKLDDLVGDDKIYPIFKMFLFLYHQKKK